jgi:hypothetical protein
MREISSIYVQLLTGLSANKQVYQEQRPSDKEDLLARIKQAGSKRTPTHTHDATDQLETIDVQAECACSVLQAVFTGHA